MRAIVGTILIVITMVLSAWVGLNEPTRIKTYEQQFEGRAIENGGQSYELYCSTCHGMRGEGVPGKGPELNPRLFTEREVQLKAEKWGGSIGDFVELTVSGGRPVRSVDFADAGFAETMPTWSQRYGGPLRDDQIRDIVAYVVNWRPDPNAVPANTPVPSAEAVYPPTTELPAGDAARGEALFTTAQKSGVTGGNLACNACHSLQPDTVIVGPSLAGIGTRAETRLTEDYKGQATDAAGYIHESIVQPNAHIAGNDPQFMAGTASKMPGMAPFLTPQDLADVIAYLVSLK